MQCKYVSQTHPLRSCQVTRRFYKIIDKLQAENSGLLKRVKELERNPHSPEEEDQSATNTRAAEIKHFGRLYAYMVNLFMTAKACAPSKDAKSYDPSNRFGTQRKEGDFRELANEISEELDDDLNNRHEFFTKNVECLPGIVDEWG
jgi:hypothetical protein